LLTKGDTAYDDQPERRHDREARDRRREEVVARWLGALAPRPWRP
jgi:hypothetical protein